MGSLQVHLAISLAVLWMICYFCVWKGVYWTGKVLQHIYDKVLENAFVIFLS